MLSDPPLCDADDVRVDELNQTQAEQNSICYASTTWVQKIVTVKVSDPVFGTVYLCGAGWWPKEVQKAIGSLITSKHNTPIPQLCTPSP